MPSDRVCAQPLLDPCADTLDPLVVSLAQWVGRGSAADYNYSVVGSGAALTLAYAPTVGFNLPPQKRLLWPGNLLALADTTYAPEVPGSLATAQTRLLTMITAGRKALVLTPEPVFIYAVDTSFGDPWFFVTSCRAGQVDTSMWDSGDLKRRWWFWDDDPGANSIWWRPEKARPPRGRQVLLSGMRHCVLAARPRTEGSIRLGLAAFEAGQDLRSPGAPAELVRIGVIRRAASTYLLSELELWPPDRREPVRLAAYYLQKAAESWTELSHQADDWPILSAQRREELLTAVQTHETAAAVAFDEIVSSAPE